MSTTQMMTPEEHHRFALAMAARLSEHCAGFVIVGFHAVTGEMFSVRDNQNDAKTMLALNNLLLHSANGLGVVVQHLPPGNPNGNGS